MFWFYKNQQKGHVDIFFGFTFGKGFDHGINGSRCFSITQTDTYIIHNFVIFFTYVGPIFSRRFNRWLLGECPSKMPCI